VWSYWYNASGEREVTKAAANGGRLLI